ncbi:hypothetical protein [Streptomyces cyanogenus]|uniref:Uncharacterized protein n=1 Tax=Streptomyces cyanogenus TaxID=80860 RepID=A0ABX7TLI1_STRCY|nr:hypothetical protein [Streptomyces cyanogenus]QTD97580.1 hypothetical protein S1361_09490 [Streptomyces cyanogenus]
MPIVDPRVQIEIKRMMPVWDPSRPRRAKDAEDIARLEAALRGRAAGSALSSNSLSDGTKIPPDAAA